MSTINLLPDDYVKKQSQKRANIFCIVLFGVIMAGVMFAAHLSSNSNARLVQQRNEVNEEYSRALSVIDKMRQMELRKDSLALKASNTASLMERAPRSYLLGLVTQLCPRNLTLYKFELATKKPKAVTSSKFAKAAAQKSRPSDYLVELCLTGYASSATDVDVARYLLSLENSPLVVRADLETTKDLSDDEMTVREFKCRLFINTELDVIELAKQADAKGMTLAAGESVTDQGADK